MSVDKANPLDDPGALLHRAQAAELRVAELQRQKEALENGCAYHARRADALAWQLAHEWGWPNAESVLTRLSGDRTTLLVTFTEEAVLAYLGEGSDASNQDSKRASERNESAGGTGATSHE